MTINKIEKDNGLYVEDDESQCTVMDFDLRYEGKKPIKLVDENRSFVTYVALLLLYHQIN